MTRRARLGHGMLANALIGAACVLAQPTMDVAVDRDSVFVGEPVTLTVRVGGEGNLPAPELPRVENLSTRYLGSQQRRETRIELVNGRRVQTSFFGIEYRYELTSETAGRYRVGPIVLPTDPPRSADGPWITFSGPEEQDVARVEIQASRETVLVEEPFEITLSVFLKQLPGRNAQAHPIDGRSPPHLEIPYLTKDPIEGLEGPDLQRLMQSLLVPQANTPGFTINSFAIQPDLFAGMFPVDVFDTARAAVFMPPRQLVERDGIPYYEYRIAVRYTPRREGAFTFGPVVLKGAVAFADETADRVALRQVIVLTPRVDVKVVPPPSENRPPAFIGSVGSNVTAVATLNTQTCNVGDPLKLTLTLTGDINVGSLKAPALSRQEALARDFRVYDDTAESRPVERGKAFTYTIRPLRAGSYELPPIEAAFYHTGLRTYETVKTAPLPLRVMAVAEVGTETVVTMAAPDSGPRQISRSGDALVAGMTLDPAGSEPAAAWRPRLHLPLLAAGPLLFGCVWTGVRVRRSMAGWRASARRRRAAARARERIRAALRSRSALEKAERATGALRRYLADRLGAESGSLTPSDAEGLLASSGIGPRTCAGFRAAFETLYNATFARSADAYDRVSDESVRDAGLWIDEVEGELAQREKSRAGEAGST